MQSDKNTRRYRTLVATACMLAIMTLPVSAEAMFPVKITSGVWASYGQCAEYDKHYFMFAGGFRGDENLCASTDSSRDGDRFHLFLECSVAGKLATYMGTAYYSETFIEIKLTEYRGATGAEDVYIKLERCEK